MGKTYEGFALRIHFEQSARAKAWRRGKLARAQQPVQAVIDAWSARLLSEASGLDNPFEPSFVFEASELEALEPLWVELATSAGEKGAHAEFARFPLEGPVSCQVWDARKRRLVERPPEAREVKRDYLLAQKVLRKLVRIKTPKKAAGPAVALTCPCGAALKESATRCPACRRSFVEPLGVRAVPGDSAAARHGREHLQKLGIALDGPDSRSFTLVRPRNAREWRDATEALTRAGFRLLEAEELSRRAHLLEEVASWPRKYPLGEANDTPGDWLYTVLHSREAHTRARLEALGAKHPETLLELSRDLYSPDPGWSAAASLAGVTLDGLTGDHASAAFSLILRLASARGHQRRELPVFDLGLTVTALSRLAPELLTAKERAVHLRGLHQEACMGASRVGAWLDAVHRLEGVPLEQALQGALEEGTRREAQEKAPGLFQLAEQVTDWAVEPSELPRLSPLEDAELRSALEALARKGFPPAISRHEKAASQATPPYGLEPLQAWAFKPLARATPTHPCPECRATMKPKAKLDIPQLGPKLGPRTVQLYECDACAAEEPTVERIHITLGPGGTAKPASPQAFLDYPEAEDVARERPLGFVRRKYEHWLEASGRPESIALQLGGHPHGVYSDDPWTRLSCRHTPTLLQFEPAALGMQLPKVRVATCVCLHPECKRPGVAEPVEY